MKKTITIFGALAIASSPAIASSVAPYKTQNFKNILKPTLAKSNETVSNAIVVQSVSSYHFYFQARLSNSTYNGFPGFMNQIQVAPFTIPYKTEWITFFLQWLADNDYTTSDYHFPDLNQFTKHGFFNDPITWSSRLDEDMGHFGSWSDNKTETAYSMIHGTNGDLYLGKFGDSAEAGYNQAAKAGNVAGIMLNFGFLYGDDTYTVEKPNYALITN